MAFFDTENRSSPGRCDKTYDLILSWVTKEVTQRNKICTRLERLSCSRSSYKVYKFSISP